ncbi:MAG: DUF4261 domain-containing protein [Hyphomicrobiales bacterium]|nr:MAG: DUF4261 domain-containing protein [Hyphomicrobiales bacterium]
MPDPQQAVPDADVIDIKPSRIRLSFLLLLSASFVAGGIFLAQQPFHPKPGSMEDWFGFSLGYPTAGFFGLVFLAIGWQLIQAGRPAVRITREGIEDLRSRQPLVPWRDVASLGWWSAPGTQHLVLRMRPEAVLSEAQQRQLAQGRMIGLDGLGILASNLRVRRAALIELCQSALDAAHAQHGIAPSAAPDTKPAGNQMLLAYVVLGASGFASGAEVLAAIRARVPDYAPDETRGPEPMTTLLDVSGGHFSTLMFVDAPNPLREDDGIVRDAWWWPEAGTALAARKAHVIVSESSEGDVKAAYGRLASVTAGVVASHPSAIGVIVGNNAVWPAGLFQAAVDGAPHRLPVEVLVSLRPGQDAQFPKRDGSPSLLCMTQGLEDLGLMEIEVRGWDGEFAKLGQFMLAMATYVLSSPQPINDGDTIAVEGSPRSKVMHDVSTLIRGKRVYRVHLTPEALPD